MAATLTTVPEATQKNTAQFSKKKWTFKYLSLKLHLWLGLGSGVFLLILAFTGAIIGFEQEVPRWLHRDLFYVQPAGQQLPETQLIDAVNQHIAPAHVRSVLLSRWPNMAQIMTMPDPGGDPRGTRIFVDPYTGRILGSVVGQTSDEKFLQTMHNTHLRLTQSLGDTGKLIVSIAGAILIVETVFGLILWWRLKRATIKLRGASWFRVFFDAHNAIGIYSALFMLVISITGVVIGFDFFEPLIFKVTKSEPLVQRRLPSSTPIPGASPITPDQAITYARNAMPDGTPAGIQLPANPKAGYLVQMRVGETSPAVQSYVLVDQYSGKVLATQRFNSSRGYALIRFNRSIHTGDIWGLTGHIIMSLTSVVLLIMVVTGVVIWWKKLAV
jgi:uncharacterized iron-regulated membrane protein